MPDMHELQEMFAFSQPWWVVVLRGSVVYWFLFALLRVFARRDVGSVGTADVLLIVLIADASQNAMAGEYRSITEGCLLVSTLWGWSSLLDWLAFRSRRLRRWIEPPPLKLVQDGRLLRHNLRKEWLSVDELMSKLRQQGVDELSKVASAFIESDGEISVIQRGGEDKEGGGQGSRQRQP